jgi:hypothetical protein
VQDIAGVAEFNPYTPGVTPIAVTANSPHGPTSSTASTIVPTGTPITAQFTAQTYLANASVPFSGQASASVILPFAPFQAAITTNQYASPCINPSNGCNSNAMVAGPGNISVGDLTIGTGGGLGTLTVGPATLNASSVTLGGTNAGDATVQSGGSIQTGGVTVGTTGSPGTLSVESGGSVKATNSIAVGIDGSVNVASGGLLSVGSGAPQSGTSGLVLLPNGTATVITQPDIAAHLTASTLTFQGGNLGVKLASNTPPINGGDELFLASGSVQSDNVILPYGPLVRFDAGSNTLTTAFGDGTLTLPRLGTPSTTPQNETYLVPNVSNSGLSLKAEDISYSSGVSGVRLQPNAEALLAQIAADVFENGLTITSTSRTATAQATAMVDNVLAGRNVSYSIYGAKALASYDSNLSRSENITNIANAIQNFENQGHNVSSHIYSPSKNFFGVDLVIQSRQDPTSADLSIVYDATKLQQQGLVYKVGCPVELGCKNPAAPNDAIFPTTFKDGGSIHLDLYKDPAAKIANRDFTLSQLLDINRASLTQNVLAPLKTADATETFNIPVKAGQPINVDPPSGNGFLFRSGDGPNFTSVMLPDLPTGDLYEVDLFNGTNWYADSLLAPLTDYVFDDPLGVDAFEIWDLQDYLAGINPLSFDAQLTFGQDGIFDGTITSIASNSGAPGGPGAAVPEPSTLALLGSGAACLLALGRRRYGKARAPLEGHAT